MFLENNKHKGWIEVICGSMFSGKTEELIRRMKRAQFANLKVEIFKPSIDVRYSEEEVVSHDANAIQSTPVESAQNILLMATDVDVVVCPPFPYLELVGDAAEDVEFFVGAQNVSKFDDGAYTGEVSAKMLHSMNMDYCIVGHSERRKYFFETNQDVAEKVNKLLEVSITPIVCVGEQLEDREAGKHFDIIRSQVVEGLFHLTEEDIQKVVIAYEPVWAIGTGKTATKEQAQDLLLVHRQSN